MTGTIKLRIKRVYRRVPYETEADLHEIESVEQVGQLMRQAEQLIDKMSERKIEEMSPRNRGDGIRN